MREYIGDITIEGVPSMLYLSLEGLVVQEPGYDTNGQFEYTAITVEDESTLMNIYRNGGYEVGMLQQGIDEAQERLDFRLNLEA